MKDDALIDTNIIDVLKRIESVSDNKARVYLLTPPEYYCPTKKASLGNYVTFYCVSEACSTAGYGVTQQATKALIHINTPLSWEADCWGMFNLLYGLEILSLIPPAITDGDTDKEGSGLEQQRAVRAVERAAIRCRLKRQEKGYPFRRARRVLRKKFQKELSYEVE
ncbi:hypothetical protein [Rouxiella badensis]|jgi:hypothetical protein|uniref:hypothetical protein n=1 Tax=Rouxiella badensis TaxID=1646377 RepID=UPI003C5F566A